MKFLRYAEFLSEKENVKIDKELREYTLSHMSDDKFQLKSKDFYKEFSVLPYKGEVLEPLRKIQEKLIDAIEKSDPRELFSAIQTAERISYPFGNIYNTSFSLSQVPELMMSLDDDQKKTISTSEREFMLNNLSGLGRDIKDDLIQIMRERAEVLCSVIEALFYYVRISDKSSYYESLSRDEIISAYEEALEKSSKDAQFSFEGPFSGTDKKDLDKDSSFAFWSCEKDTRKFFLKSTISPKKLYDEETLGGIRGLKFSILGKDDEPLQDYSYFSLEDLTSRVKSFYDNILKKK